MWDVNELAPYLEQRNFSTNHPTKKYEKEWTSKWVDFTKENEKTRRNILLLKIKKKKKRVQVFCQTDIVRHIRSQTVDVKKKIYCLYKQIWGTYTSEIITIFLLYAIETLLLLPNFTHV